MTRETAHPGAVSGIVIECLSPAVDGGRYPAKRLEGDLLEIGADIFKDGHDRLAARVLYRSPGSEDWTSAPMHYVFNDDRWYAGLPLDRIGEWRFTVEAWVDAFGTWRDELQKKFEAGQSVDSELLEGAELVRAAGQRAAGAEAKELEQAAGLLGAGGQPEGYRVEAALTPGLLERMSRYGPRPLTTRADRVLAVWVDRHRAGCAAWYEMFPRSYPADGEGHGSFREAARALDRVARLGFDVVYLPPIHPIGRRHRKGPNNTLRAGPEDPGSPWAIGNEHGGHTAIAPELGTLDDFHDFVETADALGMEVALDYALQCSPDHPWVKEHPEWFFVRPDGSIKYAENPPKKYEDIYPLNFWCRDREGLWNACRDILLFWREQGIRTFRVDNPHTKPSAFWEWIIAEVHRRHPEVVFLSEAFTRPKRMKQLAKLGFSQSYTYFTWRNSAPELAEYVEELTATPMVEYFRGNFFTNTPDILHEYLQRGGPPAFRIRLLLAATLLPLYGIYSGFELFENEPLREGSEEYLHSEKYQVRARDWSAPNLDDEIIRLNAIRRTNPALQRYANIAFLPSGDEHVLCFRKEAPENRLLILVNVDPARAHRAVLPPAEELGVADDTPLRLDDLLTGRPLRAAPGESVVLDPAERAGLVLRITPWDEGGEGS